MLRAAASTYCMSAAPSSSGGRADADELHRAVLHRGGDVGREMEAAGDHVAQHHLLQAGLVDRDLAVLEQVDLAFVHIHADDVVAHFRQAGAR